jgi:hypothetical protein
MPDLPIPPVQSSSRRAALALACTAVLLSACATPQALDAIRSAPPGEPLPVREGLWQVTADVKADSLLVQALSAVPGHATQREYPICLNAVGARLPVRMPRGAEPATSQGGMPLPVDPTGHSTDCRSERVQTQAGWHVDALCTLNQPEVPVRRGSDGRDVPAVSASTRHMSSTAAFWRESDERFSGFSHTSFWRTGGAGPEEGRVGLTLSYSARFVSPDCGTVPV